MKKKKKIRVAFIINHRLNGWLGVTNYYKNLFKIINEEKNRNIELIIISDNNFSESEKKQFPKVKIIQTNLVDRNNKFLRLMNLLMIIFFGKNVILDRFLIKNKISIISHTNFLGKNSKIPSLKWFPDFQEKHFPENFSLKQKIARKLEVFLASNHASKIIVSSKTVQDDLRKINSLATKKSIILHHASKINYNIKNLINRKYLIKKFGINYKYFYLPNHFWKHKNHLIVYKAIKYLKLKKINIKLITTGNKSDYRFPDHIKYLENFIIKNKLKKNIIHLGIISQKDVYALINNCVALINPSLLEGWGNAIDHSEHFKKPIIISNIKVHKEQKPKHGIFFEPKNYKMLAKKIEDINNKKIKLMYKGNKKKIKKFYSDYIALIYKNLNLIK